MPSKKRDGFCVSVHETTQNSSFFFFASDGDLLCASCRALPLFRKASYKLKPPEDRAGKSCNPSFGRRTTFSPPAPARPPLFFRLVGVIIWKAMRQLFRPFPSTHFFPSSRRKTFPLRRQMSVLNTTPLLLFFFGRKEIFFSCANVLDVPPPPPPPRLHSGQQRSTKA